MRVSFKFREAEATHLLKRPTLDIVTIHGIALGFGAYLPRLLYLHLGSTTFWKSTWVGGSPLRTASPTLYSHARRESRIVVEALNNDQWILDLQHGNTTEIAADIQRLWRLLHNMDIHIKK